MLKILRGEDQEYRDYGRLIQDLINSPSVVDEFKTQVDQLREELEKSEAFVYLERDSKAWNIIRDVLEKFRDKWKDRNNQVKQDHIYYVTNAAAVTVLNDLLDFVRKPAEDFDEIQEVYKGTRQILEDVITERGADGG